MLREGQRRQMRKVDLFSALSRCVIMRALLDLKKAVTITLTCTVISPSRHSCREEQQNNLAAKSHH